MGKSKTRNDNSMLAAHDPLFNPAPRIVEPHAVLFRYVGAEREESMWQQNMTAHRRM